MKNVKIQIKELLNLMSMIEQFENMSKTEKLHVPGNLSYALNKNYKSFFKAYEEYEGKRLQLLQEYGVKNKKGGWEYEDKEQKKIKLTDQSKFNGELYLLLDSEITFGIYEIRNLDKHIDSIHGDHNILGLLWSVVDTVNGLANPVKEKKKKLKVV